MMAWTAREAERETRVALHLLAARRHRDAGVSDADLFQELGERGLEPMQAEYVVTRLASRGEIYRDAEGLWRPRVSPPGHV